eukprot:TRINITY_DN18992_c0_g1_i1.p1 TRINITY_DN18992_c0_g1~~TRINITY_DN18992_c0_g1_i1.p1  ORF type:complete len:384 (-),score=54.50 TRINITY_DN18992_c0_g1_i1:272-1423(-)
MGETLSESASPPGSFRKYDKMGENSGAIGASSFGSGKYIVTEKIHGANFCIIASSNEANGMVDVSFAKRTAVLGQAHNAEDFYSCRTAGLLDRLVPCARKVFERVARDGAAAGAAAVHIYGELFGGRYPHSDVEPVPRLEPVQVGIWYAPDLHFMGFDVAVDIPGRARYFLDFHVAREACEACDLLFVEPLFEGSLADCVEFQNEFETTVPARLGLPPLSTDVDGEHLPNLAEGVVVRPLTEPACRHMTRASRESARGLFKRKIEAFSEKRYQNDSWKKGKAGGACSAPTDSIVETARYEILACINDQRLAAVMSKIGRVDVRDQVACRYLLESFKEDVRESLSEDDGLQLQQSSDLQQNLDAECRVLIKRVLLERARPSFKC